MKNTVSVLYFSASADRLVRVVMAVSPRKDGLALALRLLLRQRLDLLSRLELVHAGGGDDLAILDARDDGRGVVAPARDGNRPQGHGAAFPVDDPHRGLGAALEDRRERHLGDRRRVRPLEGERRGHAEADEGWRLDDA